MSPCDQKILQLGGEPTVNMTLPRILFLQAGKSVSRFPACQRHLAVNYGKLLLNDTSVVFFFLVFLFFLFFESHSLTVFVTVDTLESG